MPSASFGRSKRKEILCQTLYPSPQTFCRCSSVPYQIQSSTPTSHEPFLCMHPSSASLGVTEKVNSCKKKCSSLSQAASPPQYLVGPTAPLCRCPRQYPRSCLPASPTCFRGPGSISAYETQLPSSPSLQCLPSISPCSNVGTHIPFILASLSGF